jgi:hypothetical protein
MILLSNINKKSSDRHSIILKYIKCHILPINCSEIINIALLSLRQKLLAPKNYME